MKKFTLRITVLLMFLAMGTFVMAQYNVTFNVDMTDAEGFEPDTMNVYIAGDFAGWPEPGTDSTLMLISTITPKVYTLTREFPDGENVIQFKYFIVGVVTSHSWDGGEWGGDPNRVAVFTGETTLENIWGNKPSSVTFNVDMADVVFNPDTTDIYIAGNFAGWAQPGSVLYWKMEPTIIETTYSITATIYNGEQQYKYFMVYNGEPSWDHGEWSGDPNRVVTVDTTMVFDDVWAFLGGIIDLKAEITFSLYPNPVDNILTIEKLDGANKIEIYNVVGKLLKTVNKISTPVVTINTADLTSGIYFVIVHNNGSAQSTKFIKN